MKNYSRLEARLKAALGTLPEPVLREDLFETLHERIATGVSGVDSPAADTARVGIEKLISKLAAAHAHTGIPREFSLDGLTPALMARIGVDPVTVSSRLENALPVQSAEVAFAAASKLQYSAVARRIQQEARDEMVEAGLWVAFRFASVVAPCSILLLIFALTRPSPEMQNPIASLFQEEPGL